MSKKKSSYREQTSVFDIQSQDPLIAPLELDIDGLDDHIARTRKNKENYSTFYKSQTVLTTLITIALRYKRTSRHFLRVTGCTAYPNYHSVTFQTNKQPDFTITFQTFACHTPLPRPFLFRNSIYPRRQPMVCCKRY